MGDALHVSGGVTDAKEARLAQGGLIAVQGPTVLDARTGVLAGPGSTTLVTGTASTGPMTVSIAPHVAVTSRGSANGPYLGPVLEAATTVSVAAAPASGARIDVVYAKQQDATSGVPSPDVTTAPLYGVVTGTSGTTPTKPSIPVGAEELATVRVAAGATSTNGSGVTITNTARQTTTRGGILPVANATERRALAAYPGLQALELDTGRVFVYTGVGSNGWQPLTPNGLASASLRQTAGQFGFAGGTWGTVSYQVADKDTHGGWNAGAPTRWTCPTEQAGSYLVEGKVQLGGNAALNARILKNGAPLPTATGGSTADASLQSVVTGVKLVDLAVGEYVELQGYNTTNPWGTVVFPDGASSLTLTRLS